MSAAAKKNERTISHRIIALLIIASLLLIGQSLFNLFKLDQVDHSLSTVHQTASDLEKLAREISTPIAEIRMLSMELVLSPNQKDISIKGDQLDEQINGFESLLVNWRHRLSESFYDQTTRVEFQAIESEWQTYLQALTKTRYYMEQGIRVAAFISVTQQEKEHFQALQDAVSEFRQTQSTLNQTTYEIAQSDSTFSYYTLMATASVQIIILNIILFLVYRMFRTYMHTSALKEKELADAKDIAESATEAKSDFLANMSHEIRTPMNAILGMTHLCMQTELTAKQHDYLSKVHSSANALLGIINDILDFSKIEAGKMDMETIDFNLEEVLGNVSTLISDKAHDKKLEFLIQSPVEIPKFLIGDPLRLSQVLINLANNAVKFTDEGEVVIAVSLLEEEVDRTATNGDVANLLESKRIKLRFAVRDTGIGLTEAQINRLFQSFSQADASTTRKFGGTGLGLTISKSLVEMMGGEIYVESVAGEGSSFIFTAEFGQQVIRKETVLVLAEELKGLRVLVVDDNETARQIFQEILESFEFKVEFAFTGGKAIDALTSSEKPFDLIIMDWKMPGMNGIETTEQIKNHLKLPQVPKIIMCTSYGREELMKKADGVGLDGYLMKPVNPSVLLDTVLQVFGKATTGGQPKSLQSRGGQIPEIKGLDGIRGARILLVEDNEINQQVAQELLESQGFFVEIANNGQEGVDKAVTNQYDAVLMDIQMPVMGGYQAAENIRKEDRLIELPIIAMTANAMVGDREKALAVGMNDHVAKPIDPQNLYASLVQWVKAGERELPSSFTKSEETDEKAEEGFPSELPGIDSSAGLSRLGGNTKLYRNLLNKFAQNQGSALKEIQAALQDNDIELAERLAHTIKGVAGNIGAMELHSAARDLESEIKDALNHQNQSSDRAVQRSEVKITADLLEKVHAHLEQVLTSIASLKNGVTKTETEAISFDVAVVKLLVRELTELLEDDDTEAAKVLEQLKQQMRGSEILDELDQLENLIGQYDFEEAIEWLNRLVSKRMEFAVE
ncbi:MAG: response regulator [SAR324 cluster bacterium]|nr:response regulator [SAR324 cluster bacterium]